MAIVEMDFAMGGGGEINLTLIERADYNIAWNNHSFSVEIGKTYALSYIYATRTSTPTTVTGGDIITEILSNGANWTADITYRIAFIKATSNTLVVNNASVNMYGMMLIQLD